MSMVTKILSYAFFFLNFFFYLLIAFQLYCFVNLLPGHICDWQIKLEDLMTGL